jgi:hypothetical protein
MAPQSDEFETTEQKNDHSNQLGARVRGKKKQVQSIGSILRIPQTNANTSTASQTQSSHKQPKKSRSGSEQASGHLENRKHHSEANEGQYQTCCFVETNTVETSLKSLPTAHQQHNNSNNNKHNNSNES